MRSRWVLAASILLLASCSQQDSEHIAQVTTGGNAARGAAAITRYGCGSCHMIPGIGNAHGLSGPSLSGIASRTYIAGVLPNTPDNMIKWLENPQAVDPKTLMPNMGVTPQDAKDIGGYLYGLK